MFNKKYSNGGDCMCEGETTQRRSTAHNGTQRRRCAVVRRCVVSTDRYGDAGSTGSHHIGLGIGLRFRVKFRIRVRAWSGVTLLAMLIVDPVSLYVLQ